MEVRYFFLARYLESLPDGSFSAIGGGLEVIQATALPHLIPSMSVYAKLALDRADIGQRHALRIRAVAPGDEQFILTDDIDLVPNFELPPDRDYVLAIMAVGFQNVLFTIPGVYQFELLYDGERVAMTRLRLNPPAPPQMAPEAPVEGAPE
jgi:hypothetical protein